MHRIVFKSLVWKRLVSIGYLPAFSSWSETYRMVSIKIVCRSVGLINLQKQKVVQSPPLQQGLFVLISGFWQTQRDFFPLLNVYFNDLQINSWLHLSTSLWGNSSSLRLAQKKKRPEKIPFMAKTNWITLAVHWSVKYFYALNSPIFRKSRGEPCE